MFKKIFGIIAAVAVLLAANGVFAENEKETYSDLLRVLKEISLHKFSEEELADIKICFSENSEFSGETIAERCLLPYDEYARYNNPNPKTAAESAVDSYRIDDRMGFLAINSFYSDPDMTMTEIVPILERFDKQGVRALIIDMRGNSGGFLTAAVDFVKQFMPERGQIVELRGYYHGEKEEILQNTVYISSQKGKYADWKLAVLVDGETASAAEIAAGALQMLGARVFGVKTYGKGTAQDAFILEGKEFYITTEKIFFPNGVSLEKNGIVPDVESAGEDALEKALRCLRRPR